MLVGPTNDFLQFLLSTPVTFFVLSQLANLINCFSVMIH